MAHALVIDDSRAMRSLLKRMVTQMGFEPLEAEHGQAALDQLDANGPCAIALVDWNMPVMDGLEFVRTARGRRDLDRMRIVMVTSEASPRNVYEAMKAGADEYAMKPVTTEILADKLHLLGVVTPSDLADAP
ncbi:response regulator [Euzebya sp.]|uniref:response regulator n=1 Tax=Euzebya sp. TaxID=1971409 RepID=UPI003518E9B5